VTTAQLVTTATADQLARLLPLAETARGYVANARASSTRAAYSKRWAHFATWCAQNGLEPLPAAPRTLALYLAARAQEGRKVATLAQTMSAISKVHALAGHQSPAKHEAVTEMMEGIRRTHGSAPSQKTPLLAGQLRVVAATLPITLLGVRDRALLLVGFGGAFRRSELVALTVADVAFTDEGLTIVIRRSKTDQEGNGQTIAIPYGSAAATCPVRSLQDWLEITRITEGPIFRSVDRHENLGGALGAQDVARVVKRAAVAAGLNPASFAGHSLRAGLATSAAKAGKSASTIMKTTRHRSHAMVAVYVRDAELFTDNAAAGLL
jgi:integrase